MTHPFDAISVDDLRRRRSQKWRAYPADVLPAFVAEMDFPVAEPIRAALRDAIDRDDLGYAPVPNVSGIPEATARWCEQTYGWAVDPDRVIVIPDVVRGLDIGTRAFSAPGDAVIVTPPIYHPFLFVPRDADRRRIDVMLRETPSAWELDFDGIEQAMRAGARVLLWCHPHNPLGRVWHDEELDHLVALADRYGCTIVSDEIHGPLTYNRDHQPLAARSETASACTVTVTSASKAWNLAGLKCAVTICSTDAQREALMALPSGARAGTGLLGVIAMHAAMDAGQPWLDDVVRYLDGNRRYLFEAIASNLPGVTYRMPDATYLGWLDFSALTLAAPAAEYLLRHARVALSDGAMFGGPAACARLNFGTSRPILERIIDRIAAAVARSGSA